jgi:flagellar FliJ protein
MSKSFQFPLQKVLNYRKSVEDKCVITLKRSQTALQQAEETLQAMEHTKDYFLDEQTGKTAHVSLAELQVSTDYLKQINNMIDRQTIEVVKSEKTVEKDRAVLLNAAKERKITEKLRENKFAEYVTDSRKKELLANSEIALQVSARKKENAQ